MKGDDGGTERESYRGKEIDRDGKKGRWGEMGETERDVRRGRESKSLREIVR